MSNVSSILEVKHEVVINFPADYILPLKKSIGNPLKTITQHLDQVSTFLLVLGLEAWNWTPEITMNNPHFVKLHIFCYKFMLLFMTKIFHDINIWWQKYLTIEIFIAEYGWWFWSEQSSCSSAWSRAKNVNAWNSEGAT